MNKRFAAVIAGTISTFFVGTSAQADLVNVNGKTYSIQTLTGTFDSNQTILKSTAWWGQGSNVSTDFARAYYNAGFLTSKTYFAYNTQAWNGGTGVNNASIRSGGVWSTNDIEMDSTALLYAYTTPLPSKTS